MKLSAPEQFAQDILKDAELIVVDVGAARFLPINFRVLEQIATLCLVEPYKPAADQLKQKYAERGQRNVKVLNVALASSDAERTLYVTHVPTSSSLLKPKPPEYFDNPDYVYPVTENLLQTRRLDGVLSEASLPRADAIKIDVQGAELEVLQGLGASFANHTLMVEMEIGFPGSYLNQPGFAQVDAFMTAAGFELFDLRPARHHRAFQGDRSYYPSRVFGVAQNAISLSKRIDEADAVYFRSAGQLLERKDPIALRRLIVMHCAYGFFIESCDLIDRASRELIFSEMETKALRASIIGWHRATRDILSDSAWFAELFYFVRGVRRVLQRRLLGKRFWRWLD